MNQETTIVFVTYNSTHLVNDFLSSLGDYPIIVVDNASKDNTCEQIQNQFPSVRLLKNTVNIGYGRAANQAFKQVTTKYALLVNPDTSFTANSVDALESKISHFSQQNWLFVAPNTQQNANNRSILPQLVSSKPKEITFAGGAAMLFNIDAFRALGGFDENIFLYFEETDLCTRAARQHYKMYYCDDIHFPHAWGQSSSPSKDIDVLKQWHYDWSAAYFAKKHQFWGKFLPMMVKRLLIYPIKLRSSKLSVEQRLTYLSRLDTARAHLAKRNAFTDDAPFIPNTNEFMPPDLGA